MVQIPTARDLNRVGTRSGRISPSGPSVSVGAAVANVGQAITQVAFDLNDLKTQEANDNANKRGLDVSTALTRFADEEERAFLKAQEESSESGIGFTRSFMEGYQQRANEFAKTNLNGLAPEQSTGYLNQILSRGNSLYEKAYTFEATAKSAFYDRTTNTNLDTVRGQIMNNAAPYEQLKAQGLASIDAADMPEAWKAERRQMWDADAAESKWQWEYQQNPESAVAAITMGTVPDSVSGVIEQAASRYGQDADTLKKIAMLESRGNPAAKNPSSSAGGLFQFIDGTANDYGLADRFDPGQASDAAARLLRDNRERLVRNLGREPTPGELYLAHQQGAGGAINLLRDPSQPATAVLGREQVRLNLPSSMRDRVDSITAGEFASLWTRKMGDVDSAALYASIPTDRRIALATEGQKAIAAQATAERTAEKDRIALVIADDPFQVDRATIMDNPVLDDADKATLLNSWNTATKEQGEIRNFLSQMSEGTLAFNPMDSTQRATADKVYDDLLGNAADDAQAAEATQVFVESTGYIPRKEVAAVRLSAMSNDPTIFTDTMLRARTLQNAAPAYFGEAEGMGNVRADLEKFRTYTESMGYSSEDAAGRILAQRSPENRINQEVLAPRADKVVRDLTANEVAGYFDGGWRVFGGTGTPGAGADAATQSALVSEFGMAFRERFFETGDEDEAKALAAADLKKTWGTSEIGGSRELMKYPPEMFYPAVNGSHEYLRTDVMETAREFAGSDPSAMYLRPWVDPTTGRNLTSEDIRAGRPPRYRLIYEREENGQRIIDMAPGAWAVPEDQISSAQEAAQAERMQAAQERRQFQQDTVAPVAGEAIQVIQNAAIGRPAPVVERAQRAGDVGAAVGAMAPRVDAPVMPGPIPTVEPSSRRGRNRSR